MQYFSVKNLLWFLVFSVVIAILAFSGIFVVSKDDEDAADKNKQKVDVLWKKPAEEYLYWSFTAGGEYYTVVRPGGKVSLYHYTGVKKYEITLPGVDRAISTADGAMAMAYSHKDASQTSVVFLDPKGKVVGEMDMGGSIWSADVWNSLSECRFAVGTGNRQVYCVIYDRNGRRYNRWRAPGIVVSLSFEKNGYNLLYGTWQKSFLLRSTRRGTVRWSSAVDPAALSEVASLGDGNKWRALVVPNRLGSDATLKVLTDDGKLLLEENIEAKNRSRVLFSYSGNYVCIGFEKKILHSGKAITEYHAKLLDGLGHEIWNKGSMFLRLKPLAVMDDGNVVACAPDGKVHLIDSRGNISLSEPLGGDVVNSVWAPKTGRVLVECADGYMYMLVLNEFKKD